VSDDGVKVLSVPGDGDATMWRHETTFSNTAQKTGAMSDTLQMDDLVSLMAGNRVWHAVSSSQSRPDSCLAQPASLATLAIQATHTLEALHNLTRSGASSPPSRMSPAAPLPDCGYPG
jgi:hypothetical protein